MSSPPADSYATHQEPHSDENQIRSAVADTGPEKPDACEACGRDVTAGERLCETCAWVAREYGEELLWADGDGGDEDVDAVFDAAFEEADPVDHAFDAALEDAEPGPLADLEDEEKPRVPDDPFTKDLMEDEEEDEEGPADLAELRDSVPEEEPDPLSRPEEERTDREEGEEEQAVEQMGLGGASFGEVEKPEYSVPSVEEIREREGTSGFNLISTFSGCGGICLGFRMAGFEVLWANEFVEAARETYLANFPKTPVDPSDIRDLDPEEVLDGLGLEPGEVDVLEGGPPCASFSTAGVREEGWGEVRKYSDTEQRVDDLFWEYMRFVKGMRPKVFLAENTSGLLIGEAQKVFDKIYRELREMGYVVDARVLNAAKYGVPQARRRTLIQGVRRDLFEEYDVRPAYPRPLQYQYTIRDALPWLDDYRYDTKGNYDVKEGADRPCPTITISNNAAHHHHELTGDIPLPEDEEDLPPDMREYAIGEEWQKLEPGEQSEKYFSLMRPDPDAPSPTVTQTAGSAGAAGVAHPLECRKFAIPELRRICGFPDDFELTGDYQQRWERLGRALPPPLTERVARAIKDEILTPIREDRDV